MYRGVLLLALSLLSAQGGLSELEAISMIESGNNDRAIGGAGEISRFQIMPRVWKTYTASRAYQNIEVSRRIARKHLTYLETMFQSQTGRPPTDFDRYVLWNAGPTYYARVGFVPGRVHRIIRERANRYVNLRQMPTDQTSQGILALGVLR
ncbi:MAG TPA: hypothetical protein VK633_07725 [Verrucomicrobiae bacterium]|nr:hypothetical protein [Verrucomicrobiae bacterium]